MSPRSFLATFSALLVGACAAPAPDAAIVPGAPCATGCEKSTTEASAPTGAVVCAKDPPKLGAPASCAAHGDALDDALGALEKSRCSLSLGSAATSTSKLDVNDPRAMPIARKVGTEPLTAVDLAKDVGSSLDLAATRTPVSDALALASGLRGGASRGPCTQGAFYASKGADPLAAALAELGSGVKVGKISDVPRDLADALVPILRAIAWANREVILARGIEAMPWRTAPDDFRAMQGIQSWLLGVRRFDWSPSLPDVFEGVDVRRMESAATVLARTIEQADLGRFRGRPIARLEVETRVGALVLGGPARDMYAEGSLADGAALLVDTGGDDTYEVPAGAGTLDTPVSVVVDLDGNDRYGYVATPSIGDGVGRRLASDGEGRVEGRTASRTPRQGAGDLGIGMLFDLGKGNDRYQSLSGSQGTGAHGVGVLYDEAGDDSYLAEGFSQGAAAWGTGLLLDRAGNDRYELYHAGQGFGFTEGVGLLVDGSGDDVYFANPGEPKLGGDILYPSDQLTGLYGSPTANHSMSQGCGAGHRPDWPDPGYPFPGGIGVLLDVAGADHYIAGVFAQGAGFVQGAGIFVERAGDDRYDGLYYVQGSAAHLAGAVHYDAAGNDRYNPSFHAPWTSLGVGHDLSTAVHYDGGGNDTYRGTGVSFGAGLANGLGVFIDAGGKDVLESDTPSAFGVAYLDTASATPRASLLTVGLFVRAGGASAYSAAGKAAALGGKKWANRPSSVERGAGVDAPSGKVTL